MAKVDIVKDLLVKITNIFRNDLYISHNKFCLGGKLSEDLNIGHYLCELTEEVTNAYNEVIDKADVIYIESIKNAKTDFDSCIKKVIGDEKENVEKQIDTYVELFRSVNEWKKFQFTETDINILYDDVNYLHFHPEGTDSTVIISKTLFPLMKEKDFQNAYYHINKNIQDNLDQMLITYDFKYFQLHMEYTFINTKFEDAE